MGIDFVDKVLPPRESLKGLSTKRINRIIDDILPLMTGGFTSRQIAEKLNISKSQAALDMAKAKEIYAETYKQESIEEIRGEAIARAEYIFAEAMQAWRITKAQGAPVAKYLDVGVAALQKKVQLAGAEVDLKLIHQQVNVSMATADQVAETFQPMDAADFKAFAAAHADAQVRAAAAAKAIMPSSSKPMTNDPVIESGDTDDAGWLEEAVIELDDAPSKNRKINHPFR